MDVGFSYIRNLEKHITLCYNHHGGVIMKPISNETKVIITCLAIIASLFLGLFLLIILSIAGLWSVTIWACILTPPLLIPFLWVKKRKLYAIIYFCFIACIAGLIITQNAIRSYNESITIDVTPNINTREYLPFDENSKIVKIDSKLLSFDDVSDFNLPIIDGATAAFPVYSAFVHAVYPEDTKLNNGVFEFNNTVGGYQMLAQKKTDIFIGAAPSKEQVEYAEQFGTTFEYTQIGYEAFVFFVHKDNPIDSLTLDQIKGIYSGQITNWSQVGGKDEEIVPFQRDEGSGSQSMLIRLMGDTPIIEPDIQERVSGMGGIIKEVADYKNKSTSIGFSFRFYVEGMIKNPDIKMIAINDVAPTKENIQSVTYPIIAPVYAVTYEGNLKENVYKLIEWMLSEEGQYIIEETGYVGMN